MKKILLIIYILIFTSCTSLNKKVWTKINKKEIILNLEPGDIIIKEKTLSPLGIFGHSAIMKTERIVFDYPKLGQTSYEIDINYWLEKNRDIIVLRYKKMNEKFREKLLENMEKFSKMNYKIVFNKRDNTEFYCSHFIWYIYYQTAKDLGFVLDIDSDKGLIVFPYDFINSNELKIIY
ncbi:YiiX/YebB-like N1pC/P60 family cysteine hydrolase [Fusobacterium sp.]|uniref:YiiX/YebB-like N1pC/P60 family cysteine hydrolase n=1 Tax=Fusobacterium sp. TaxID=68766 RepID=UPI0025C2E84E|nr:YiiX/YebB-like N1pC/P60 family cysteine hydrolase [Fusobacterium sp.]MCI7222729.1 hypothetical protein [Fusobacterium sp.]